MPPNRKQRRTSKVLTRAAILSADKSALEKVNVPEWGGDVYVCAIKANEFERFRDKITSNGQADKAMMIGGLVSLVACDSQGKRLFTDDDTERVSEFALAPLLRVFRAAMKFNNLSDDDVDELVKN